MDLFDKFVAFSNQIVDHFGKIVDLLFERGVLQHLEKPPGYGPVLTIIIVVVMECMRLLTIVVFMECQP